MSASTPGPWESAESGKWFCGKRVGTERFVRRPGDDVGIASDIIDPETSQPSEANARLIAAAPDLLDALSTMTRLCRIKYGNLDKQVFAEIEQAEKYIANATGKEIG